MTAEPFPRPSAHLLRRPGTPAGRTDCAHGYSVISTHGHYDGDGALEGVRPADIGDVVRALDEHGVAFDGLSWSEPDLEDVYLRLAVDAEGLHVAARASETVAAANAIGLPLLFLSETFVPPAMLPEWFQPVMALSPLTYFAGDGEAALLNLAVLVALAVAFFALGAWAIPRTE